MPLVHIVLFEFKPSVERAVIQDVREISFAMRGNRGVWKRWSLCCVFDLCSR